MKLTQNQESKLETILRKQPFGAMIASKDAGIELVPFEVYKGERLGAQRKIVDHLDQITIWRVL